MEFGQNLRRMRIKAGHTQESLAFGMGVCTSLVNRVESGKQKLKVELIPKIAKAMEKSPESIISELYGITVNITIQENNGNGVKIDNIESIKELYEKILAEKERYVLFLENELRTFKSNKS